MKEVGKEVAYVERGGESGVRTLFVPSGYKGAWIKITETYDYLLSVEYADGEECEKLGEIRKEG